MKRRRAWQVVEAAEEDGRTSRVFDIVILSLIALSVLATDLPERSKHRMPIMQRQEAGSGLHFERVACEKLCLLFVVLSFSPA